MIRLIQAAFCRWVIRSIEAKRLAALRLAQLLEGSGKYILCLHHRERALILADRQHHWSARLSRLSKKNQGKKPTL